MCVCVCVCVCVEGGGGWVCFSKYLVDELIFQNILHILKVTLEEGGSWWWSCAVGGSLALEAVVDDGLVAEGNDRR